MKIKLLLLIFLCFFFLQGTAQITVTATATPSACINNGSITITASGLPSTVTYGIAKTPFSTTNVISGSTPVFTMLEPGDYYYGYYTGSTFVKSATTINVSNTYSSISPTFQSYTPTYYAYCGSTDPLGQISGVLEGGNTPFKIEILNTSGGTIQQKLNHTDASFAFTGVPAGDYRLRATDACGTVVTTPTIITLKPNVPYDFSMSTLGGVSDTYFNVTYNIPNNVCSGIKTARLVRGTFLLGRELDDTDEPLGTQDKPKFYGTKTVVYKLEIQNETGAWDVYDNLSYNQVYNGNFPMPLDRTKWAGVKLSVTICGVTKTNQRNLSSFDGFMKKSLTTLRAYISDDPANTVCVKTGKVLTRFANSSFTGCYPISVAVTENGTSNTQQGSIIDLYTNPFADFMLDIGKSYTVVIHDADGDLATGCYFQNNTTSTSTKPTQTNMTNLNIDPAFFTPNQVIRDQITLVEGPDTKNFGKSALIVRGINKTQGFVGAVHFKTVSGPSTIDKTVAVSLLPDMAGAYQEIGLGSNLPQGTYKIKITDDSCFNEEYTVVVESYIVSVTIQNLTYTPSSTVCDRYIKSGEIKVTAVGKLRERPIGYIYGYDQVYVGLKSAPVNATKFGLADGLDIVGNGILPFSFVEDVAGRYEIALTPSHLYQYSLIPTVAIHPTSTVVPLEVLPNYPAFDMTRSGGVICPGNTTGTLNAHVTNITGSATYFIKKESDANYPAVGQTSSVFTGLVAGNYVIKVKTACYEVVQMFNLQLAASVSNIIVGDTEYCIGESLDFSHLPIGPSSSVKWTLPDGSIVNTSSLHIDNLVPTMSGIYQVEVITTAGCSFTESVTVKIKARATAANITTANQTKCSGESIRLIASSAEPNKVLNWYSDAALTNLLVTGEELTVAPTVTTTYYVTVQSDNFCENAPGTGQTVTVTVNPWAPADAITAADQTICVGTLATLQATTTISNPVFMWYNGNAVGSGSVGTGNSLVVNPVVTTTYYVGVYGTNTCETKPTDRKAVTVFVNPTIGIPTNPSGTRFTACQGTTTSYTSTATNSTSITYSLAPSTAGSINATTGAVNWGSAFVGDATVTVTAEGCNGPKTAVYNVTVEKRGLASDITIADQTICIGSSATLSASSTSGTYFTYWTIPDDISSVISQFNSDVTVSPTVTTTYYVTTYGPGICENTGANAKAVTVTVLPTIESPIFSQGLAATICAGTTETYTATSVNSTGITYTISPLNAGTINSNTGEVVWSSLFSGSAQITATAERCGGPLATTHSVNVKYLAKAADILVADKVICKGETISLGASLQSSSLVVNPIFKWYSDAALTTELGTGATYAVSPTVTTTYYTTVLGNNTCENIPNTGKAVTVTVNPNATANTITINVIRH